MYLVENINNFNINNVYFSSSLENTVIDEGTFSKLIYSTSDVVINGIYLLCSFSNTIVEKIAYNKFKISWNKDKNAPLIEAMKMIEHKIMVKYGKKKYSNQLSNFLDYNNFRIFSEEKTLNSNSDFILRISGIWENEKDGCGITYKFLEVNTI